MNKQNIPKLRFPEFKGEWEIKRLGDVVNSKSEKYNPFKERISHKCIELEHLSSETAQLLGYIDSINSGSIKNKFNNGDVLFGKLRPYLKKYFQPTFDGVCSSEIWVLTGIGISNDFLFRIVQLNSFIELANQSTGSKMPRADWNVIKNGVFSFPSLSEQQKIASFFTSIDQKLTQLKQKKNLLEEYKKGLMQKLFSQELRFKIRNEDGELIEPPKWEKKKLGEVFYSEKGKGISKNKVIENGKYECILYGELYTKYNEVIFEVVSKTNEDDGIKSQNGDLLIPSSTTTTGIDLANVTALNKDGVLLGGDITVLRSKKKINNIFYAYYLSNQKKDEIASYAQGSTIVHLYYSHIKDMCIDLPSLAEQTLIANFLTAIDKKIMHCEKQIEQTEIWKKGLLQKMFV